MGQQEVYDFLRNNPDKWFTSKQIAENMKASYGSVTNNLAKLRKTSSIIFKISKRRTNSYLYKFKE